jgi:hypothetical protein
MKDNLFSKEDNKDKGYYYTVTQEQIKAHQKRSIKEIFAWIESTNRFVYKLQTPEERERLKKSKCFQH